MTNKGHFNKIVNDAIALNNQLEKIREKANKIIEDIEIHGDEFDYDDYIYQLSHLKETLEDLSSFDLEDSIPERHTANY